VGRFAEELKVINNQIAHSVPQMEYPDPERRIEELRRIEAIFNGRAFVGTASRIYALSFLIKDPTTQKALLKEYYDLLMIFAQEFSQKFSFGQEYRERCFEEIANLIFDAVVSTDPSKPRKSLSDLEPILVSLNKSKKTIDEISKVIQTVTRQEARFHLICYSYLIIVEGIFDELVRIIFFFSALKKGKEVTISDLTKMEVKDIFKKIEPKPIILKNWWEKKHIRNAIGHATVNYDLSKNQITFIDNYAEPPFERNYRFQDFIEILAELESAAEAFILFMLLLKVKDVLFAEKAFDTT
jgi:hypothetical protein